MNANAVAVFVLLLIGAGISLLSCIGVLAARGVYDKIHYLAPAAIVATAALAAAVIVQAGMGQGGIKSLLILILLLISNPVLSQATGRAALTRKSAARRARQKEDP